MRGALEKLLGGVWGRADGARRGAVDAQARCAHREDAPGLSASLLRSHMSSRGVSTAPSTPGGGRGRVQGGRRGVSTRVLRAGCGEGAGCDQSCRRGAPRPPRLTRELGLAFCLLLLLLGIVALLVALN